MKRYEKVSGSSKDGSRFNTEASSRECIEKSTIKRAVVRLASVARGSRVKKQRQTNTDLSKVKKLSLKSSCISKESFQLQKRKGPSILQVGLNVEELELVQAISYGIAHRWLKMEQLHPMIEHLSNGKLKHM
jgi:hypothetical protein